MALISLLGCFFHAILFKPQQPGEDRYRYYLFPTDGETEAQRSEGLAKFLQPGFQTKPTDQGDCTPSHYSWPL